MWTSLRAIADEAIATAKELRDINRDGMPENDDHSDEAIERKDVIPHQAPTMFAQRAAPAAQPPQLQESLPPSLLEHASLHNKSENVSSRLAALKAKIAAQQSKPVPVSVSLDDTAQKEIQLQLPLKQVRKELINDLTAVRQQNERSTEEQRGGNQSLKAALVAQGTSSHEDNDHHETAVKQAKAETHAARDQVLVERARALSFEATASELQSKLERAEVETLNIRKSSETELEDVLASSNAECAALRSEVARQRAEVQALRLRLESAELPQETATSGGESVGTTVEALKTELTSVYETLSATEAERNAAKQQLTRLKTQMLAEQEDEDEKITWRVNAEVKLALEKLRAAGTGTIDKTTELRLRGETAMAIERAERAEESATRWEQVASARDAELSNMQSALGELSFESEVAERLRAELRSMQKEVHALKTELEAAQAATLVADEKMKKLEGEATEARNGAAKAREAEAEAQREILAARVAAQSAIIELQSVRQNGGAIDKPLVLRALSGVLGLKPKAALDVASNILKLTAEDIQTVLELSRDNTAAAATGKLPSLAASWIDFLETTVEDVHVKGASTPSDT